MKYENAKDILPESLLAEVQKYAGGKLLYIPVENEPKSWGEASGYRQKLLKRNVMISNRYKSGATLSELAEEYFLSLDSIKKIVYGKKEKELLFEATVESAVKYSNAGLLEEWLTMYSGEFLNALKVDFEDVICCGIRKVPLRLIEKSVMANSAPINKEYVTGQEKPLLISYQNGMFKEFGQAALYNHLQEQKVNAYPSILMVNKEEYKVFERYYGRYFVTIA